MKMQVTRTSLAKYVEERTTVDLSFQGQKHWIIFAVSYVRNWENIPKLVVSYLIVQNHIPIPTSLLSTTNASTIQGSSLSGNVFFYNICVCKAIDRPDFQYSCSCPALDPESPIIVTNGTESTSKVCPVIGTDQVIEYKSSGLRQTSVPWPVIFAGTVVMMVTMIVTNNLWLVGKYLLTWSLVTPFFCKYYFPPLS